MTNHLQQKLKKNHIFNYELESNWKRKHLLTFAAEYFVVFFVLRLSFYVKFMVILFFPLSFCDFLCIVLVSSLCLSSMTWCHAALWHQFLSAFEKLLVNRSVFFYSVTDLTCFLLFWSWSEACHTDAPLFEPLAVMFVWTTRNPQPDCCIHRTFKQSKTLSASPPCLRVWTSTP